MTGLTDAMPNSDTVNFNRFLTSLGLLLMVAALIVPYFYFRSTDVLGISEVELGKMTDTGREAIEGRQDHIAWLEPWVAGLAVALFVVGAVTVFFGARRLRKAQGHEDDLMEHQVKYSRREFEKLSAEEVEAGREQKAREAVDGVPESPPEEEGEGRGAPAGESPAREGMSSPGIPAEPIPGSPADLGRLEASSIGQPRLSLAETRAAIGRIEERIADVFERADLRTYEFARQVKLQDREHRRALRFDGLFTPRKDPKRPDVIFDLKLFRPLRASPISSADRLLARITRYGAATGRQARGWLIVVVPDEVDSVVDVQLNQTSGHLERLLAGAARATVIYEREIPRLPDRFRVLFDA